VEFNEQSKQTLAISTGFGTPILLHILKAMQTIDIQHLTPPHQTMQANSIGLENSAPKVPTKDHTLGQLA